MSIDKLWKINFIYACITLITWLTMFHTCILFCVHTYLSSMIVCRMASLFLFIQTKMHAYWHSVLCVVFLIISPPPPPPPKHTAHHEQSLRHHQQSTKIAHCSTYPFLPPLLSHIFSCIQISTLILAQIGGKKLSKRVLLSLLIPFWTNEWKKPFWLNMRDANLVGRGDKKN